MFSPVRKPLLGVKSNPTPQLVASSGTRPLQLPSQPPPSRIGSEPPEPPFMDMPGSCRPLGSMKPLGSVNGLVGRHWVVLPGVPLPPGPMELISFQAPEPTGAVMTPAAEQPATIAAGA